jgi:hypothetical protein
MAGKTATLAIRILGDAKDAQKALDATATSADKLQAGVGKAALPAAAALAGLAAAGIHAAKAAAEDQAAAGQLALALRNSTGATDDQIASTEAWITKTSKAAAVADDELRPALATLVRATGDVATSQDALGVALDVSAATGKDVESVSQALAKAYAGNTASLGKLVPGLDKAVLATGDMDKITAELARTTGGAAAEAAGTAAGQWKGFQIQMGEAEESIGGALLPVMSKLGGTLQGVAEWVQKNTKLFLIIAGVIGVFAGAILALNVALKAYAIVTEAVAVVSKILKADTIALNLAFLSSPVFWIIAAIVALIVVIVLIATKTTWFQDIWAATWGAIKAAAEAVWNWLKTAATAAFQFIAAVVKGYVAIYVAIWNGLVAAVGAVWTGIKAAISVALAVVSAIIRGYIAIYVGIFEGIKAGVGAVWGWLKDAAGTALSAILAPIRAVESAFDRVVDAIRDVIDWLSRIKLPKVLTDIGGAISGIFGRSASVAASSTGTSSLSSAPSAARFAAAPLLRRASSSSSSGPVTINVSVPESSDPVATARYLKAIIRRGEASGVVFGTV